MSADDDRNRIKLLRQKQRVKQWEMSVISMFGQLLAKKTRTFVIPSPDTSETVSTQQPTCSLLVEQGQRLVSEIKLPVTSIHGERSVSKIITDPLKIQLKVSGFRDSTMVFENGGSIVVSYKDEDEELGARDDLQTTGKGHASSPGAETSSKQPAVSKKVPEPPQKAKAQASQFGQARGPQNTNTNTSNVWLPTTRLMDTLPQPVPLLPPAGVLGNQFCPPGINYMPESYGTQGVVRPGAGFMDVRGTYSTFSHFSPPHLMGQ